MQNYFSIALIFCSLFLLSGCDKPISDCGYTVNISEQKYLDGPYDATTIVKDAVWDGACLELTFLYSGGCEEHSFELVSDGSILESLPPIITLGLIHDNQDLCDALITDSITVDILSFPEIESISPVFIKFKDNPEFSFLLEL